MDSDQSAPSMSSRNSPSSSCRPIRVPSYCANRDVKVAGSRLYRLSDVLPRVITDSLANFVSSILVIEFAFGVVVTTPCACGGIRSPIFALSNASVYFQLDTSSAHTHCAFCPRIESGSSADRSVATAPFGQTTRRLCAWYVGLFPGGDTPRI